MEEKDKDALKEKYELYYKYVEGLIKKIKSVETDQNKKSLKKNEEESPAETG